MEKVEPLKQLLLKLVYILMVFLSNMQDLSRQTSRPGREEYELVERTEGAVAW